MQIKLKLNNEIFFPIAVLTLFFICVEVSFFIQSNQSYLGDFNFIASKLSIPFGVFPDIGFFLLSQAGIHLLFAFSVYVMTSAIIRFFKISSDGQFKVAMIVWCAAIVTVLLANETCFPNSKFSKLIIVAVGLPSAKIALLLLLAGWVIVFILTLWRLVLLLGGVYYLFVYLIPAPIIHDAATMTHPNIIIVGVDALRPDYLGYFGSELKTPFIDEFLNESTVFSEALTPIARTFPSWISILSGAYPKQNGVRSNLVRTDHINKQVMLPSQLQQAGYHTIYATDETRFSNIDQSYGFDEIASSRMGLNDFLLGTFNDFPLSNLIINTALGAWLFPYSFANRPAYVTYHPDSFIKKLKPLLEVNRTEPFFLAVHVCLPHDPYLWADSFYNEVNPNQWYQRSVERVDNQIQELFILLHHAKLLKHAIVVLLSDHGEALALPGDRITEASLFVPSKPAQKIPQFYLDDPQHPHEINQSVGHGTDVLGLSQYHSVLAFRLYGLSKQAKRSVPGLVSLIAVKPTLLSFLQKTTQSNSLKKLILNQQHVIPNEHIFIESDFSPEAIRTVYPDKRKVMLEGIELFEIDPHTTQLFTKENMLNMIIRSKQYADVYDGWLLALYPQKNQTRMPILVNLHSGEWTNDLQSSFAHHSPAQVMLHAIHHFYRSEVSS